MTGEPTISKGEARRAAVETVRQTLGMQLRVGDGEYDPEQHRYDFAVSIRDPELIRSEDGETVLGVYYRPPVEVGTVHVDVPELSVDCPTRRELRRAVEADGGE